MGYELKIVPKKRKSNNSKEMTPRCYLLIHFYPFLRLTATPFAFRLTATECCRYLENSPLKINC